MTQVSKEALLKEDKDAVREVKALSKNLTGKAKIGSDTKAIAEVSDDSSDLEINDKFSK